MPNLRLSLREIVASLNKSDLVYATLRPSTQTLSRALNSTYRLIPDLMSSETNGERVCKICVWSWFPYEEVVSRVRVEWDALERDAASIELESSVPRMMVLKCVVSIGCATLLIGCFSYDIR